MKVDLNFVVGKKEPVIQRKNKLRWVTRNIKNWAESAKYEHFNIK